MPAKTFDTGDFTAQTHARQCDLLTCWNCLARHLVALGDDPEVTAYFPGIVLLFHYSRYPLMVALLGGLPRLRLDFQLALLHAEAASHRAALRSLARPQEPERFDA